MCYVGSGLCHDSEHVMKIFNLFDIGKLFSAKRKKSLNQGQRRCYCNNIKKRGLCADAATRGIYDIEEKKAMVSKCFQISFDVTIPAQKRSQCQFTCGSTIGRICSTQSHNKYN